MIHLGEPWVLGQSSAATGRSPAAICRYLAQATKNKPPAYRKPRDALARAGVELNFPGTTTARATKRKATIKAREVNDRVDEGKVPAGLWSYLNTILWHGVKIISSTEGTHPGMNGI